MDHGAASWDAMYATDAFVFGTTANDFLVEQLSSMAPCVALSLGEGEGRNAVWMAARGFTVTAIDLSPAGVAKAGQLAADRGVDVEFRVGDLAELELEPGTWPLIVSVFAHTPPAVRTHVHHEVVRGLAPGGRYIMEAYSPAQLGRGTGGPPDVDLLVATVDVERELVGMRFDVLREVERDVIEGARHTGLASVTQVVAVKA